MHTYIEGYMEKTSENRGLSSMSADGPEQMVNAMNHLMQAISLGRPRDEELSRTGLSRDAFENKVDRLVSHPEIKATDLVRNPVDRLPIYTGILGLLAGGIAGYRGSSEEGVAGRLVDALQTGVTAGLGGAGGGWLYNASARKDRERMLKTLSILKKRGLLDRQTMRKALPILKDI